MTKLRTEREALESSIQNLHLLNRMADDLEVLRAVEGVVPGFIHVNRTTDLGLLMCNSELQRVFMKSEEEIISGGPEVIINMNHPDEIEDIPKKILHFFSQSDQKSSFSFFQRIRESAESPNFNWWFTTSKYFGEGKNCLLYISQLTKDLISVNNQLNKLLDDHAFLRKNLRKFLTLTRREKEVLTDLAEGLTAPEIAEKRFISINTAKTHRQRIQEKLEAKTFQELYQYAFHFDLLK